MIFLILACANPNIGCNHLVISKGETETISLNDRDELFLDISSKFTLLAFNDLSSIVASANFIKDKKMKHLGFFNDKAAFGVYFGDGHGTVQVRARRKTNVTFTSMIRDQSCDRIMVVSGVQQVFEFTKETIQLSKGPICIWSINPNLTQEIQTIMEDVRAEITGVGCKIKKRDKDKNDDKKEFYQSECPVFIKLIKTGKNPYFQGYADLKGNHSSGMIPGYISHCDLGEPQLIVNNRPEPVGPTLVPRPTYNPDQYDEYVHEQEKKDNSEDEDDNDMEKIEVVILLAINTLSVLTIIVSLVLRWRHQKLVIDETENIETQSQELCL